METLHEKSPCCRVQVHHIGGRRRQCARCKRTWSAWEKRRGRKPLRGDAQRTLRMLLGGTSLRQDAARRGISREWVRRRHAAGLSLLLRRLPPPAVPPGELLAIINGLWFTFQGQEYTLYLLLLRPVRGRQAVLQDPLLVPGHESPRRWRGIFASLPAQTQQRIVALVSDGLTGIECLAAEHGWVLQRCHFHLLAQLQHFRGRRNRQIAAHPLREEVYQTVRRILAIRSERTAQRHARRLRRLITRQECSHWLGRRVRGFLENVAAFRAYRRFPHLSLPTTTNTAESAGNLLRTVLHRTRGFRTPDACHRWLTVVVRARGPMQCNGAVYQQK